MFIAALAFGVALANILWYGGNTDGELTFLYIGTALALLGSLFMVIVYRVQEHHRQSILKHKTIAIILLIIIDIVFAIPSIQFTIEFTSYLDLTENPYT